MRKTSQTTYKNGNTIKNEIISLLKTELEERGHFELLLDFGHYGETFLLHKVGKDRLEVRTVVHLRYTKTGEEFQEVVSYEEFIEFLDNRLSENVNGLMKLSGRPEQYVYMKSLMSDFAEALQEVSENENFINGEEVVKSMFFEFLENCTTTPENEWTKEFVAEYGIEKLYPELENNRFDNVTIQEHVRKRLHDLLSEERSLLRTEDTEDIYVQMEKQFKEWVELGEFIDTSQLSSLMSKVENEY